MSTTAVVFLVLGIAFAMMVIVGAILTAEVLQSLIRPASGSRSQLKNKLKQIVLAMQNYQNSHNIDPQTLKTPSTPRAIDDIGS